jgi:hypothetical protein
LSHQVIWTETRQRFTRRDAELHTRGERLTDDTISRVAIALAPELLAGSTDQELPQERARLHGTASREKNMADQQEPYSAFGETFENVPTATVYDIFADAASALSARYMRLSKAAPISEEREAWWAKVLQLRDLRLDVPADDRAALIEHIHRWRAELKALKADAGG